MNQGHPVRHQWFLVSDQQVRIPIQHTVLVCGPDWEESIPAMWDGKEWNMWTGNGLKNTITHWRALPSPYHFRIPCPFCNGRSTTCEDCGGSNLVCAECKSAWCECKERKERN